MKTDFRGPWGRWSIKNPAELEERFWSKVSWTLDDWATRRCVNPWHLEAVSQGENNNRKLHHCPSCTCREE